MRATFLPFALPDLDRAEIDAVAEVLASGWITTGEQTRAFGIRGGREFRNAETAEASVPSVTRI